jgi:tellurite resistance protein TehA-like permease
MVFLVGFVVFLVVFATVIFRVLVFGFLPKNQKPKTKIADACADAIAA